MSKIVEKIKNFEIKKFLKSFKSFSKTYFKTNILFMSFIFSSLINEILLRSLTVKNYFAIKPILADITVLLFIGSIGYLLKPKHQFKYFISWAIMFTALCIINSMYYTNYVSFASFSLLETSLQIVDVGDAVVQNVMEIKDFSYLWEVLAIIFVNEYLKRKKYYEKVSKIEKGKFRAIGTFIAGGIFLLIFSTTLTSIDISRLNKQWTREYIVMEFGAYTYQFNDLF